MIRYPKIERTSAASGTCIVEEKVDGSNLCFWQEAGEVHYRNRSGPFAPVGQYEQVPDWIRAHDLSGLGHYAIYGEWCAWTHRVYYDNLPDLFIGFDVWDCSTKSWLTTTKRDQILTSVGVSIVPRLWEGSVRTLGDPSRLIGRSRFKSLEWRESFQAQSQDWEGVDTSDLAEGVVMRVERAGAVLDRFKRPRDSFLKVRDSSKLVRNRVKS